MAVADVIIANDLSAIVYVKKYSVISWLGMYNKAVVEGILHFFILFYPPPPTHIKTVLQLTLDCDQPEG